MGRYHASSFMAVRSNLWRLEKMNTKTCTKCKKSFPLDNFYQGKRTGYTYSNCKMCSRIRTKRYKRENKEKVALSGYKYINTEKGFFKETVDAIFQRAKENKSNQTRKKWIPECTKQDINEELELYIQEHGRICEYCKEPWTYIRKMGTRGGGPKKRGPQIFTNFSIDRLDSTKTYEVRKPAHNTSNLVFCCIGCNDRKSQVTLADMDNIKRVWRERNEVE